MGVALPIMDSDVLGGVQSTGSSPAAIRASGQSYASGGPYMTRNASAVQGMGRLTGLHNTPLHVGTIVIFAAAVLVLFHKGGFRFAGSASVGGGVG